MKDAQFKAIALAIGLNATLAWEAQIQNLADQASEDYNGGMWAFKEATTEAGEKYYWWELDSNETYTVACPQWADTVEMSAKVFSLALHLYLSSHLCIHAYQEKDNRANSFWHAMHWGIRNNLETMVSEEEFLAIMHFID